MPTRPALAKRFRCPVTKNKGKRSSNTHWSFCLLLHNADWLRCSGIVRWCCDAICHYWRLRYEWSEPSLMGSLMMMSPLRILMLYRHDGLVHTHALYSMEAPWLPKSESGTRSPSPHLRQRGNAFSTISSPSFSLEVLFVCKRVYKRGLLWK